MSAFHDNALMGASGSQGYQISRSVRLRSSASAYFNRTNSSSPTNSIKWTWSGWVKRGSLGSQQNLVGATNSGSDDTYFNFNSSDKIVLGSYTGAGTDYGITTAAVFRDPSAWYHIVAVACSSYQQLFCLPLKSHSKILMLHSMPPVPMRMP